MKVTVLNSIHTKPANSFEVVINLMHGDGDMYEDIVVGPFMKDKDEAAFESFLNTVLRMKTKNYYTETYDIEGFAAWFDAGNLYDQKIYDEKAYNEAYPDTKIDHATYLADAEMFKKIANENSWKIFSWSDDITTVDIAAEYSEHKVIFYDENSAAYKVAVSFNEED